MNNIFNFKKFKSDSECSWLYIHHQKMSIQFGTPYYIHKSLFFNNPYFKVKQIKLLCVGANNFVKNDHYLAWKTNISKITNYEWR